MTFETNIARAPVALAALFALLACGGGDGVTEPGPNGEPASITISAGDQQIGTVGAELPNPLVVQVKTAEGAAVSGQTVTFHVVAGGGSVFVGSANTNAEGIARDRWTLGTVAGATQRVEVRAVNPTTGSALPIQTFTATAVAGTATTIVKAGGDNTQSTVGTAVEDRPRVRALDQYGNPVGGVTVTFAVASGNGTVTGATQTTDATGHATVGSWTPGTTGSNTLTAAAVGLSGSPLTFASTASAAAGSNITAREASTTGRVGARVAAPPSVVVREANGNPLEGVRVTFAVTQGAGTIGNTAPVTDANGIASVESWTLDTVAGTNKVTATASGLVGSPVTFAATGEPGPAEHLTMTTRPTVTIANRTVFPTQPVVQLRDHYNNAVPQAGRSVTASIKTGGGSVGGTTAVTTASNGAATFTDLYLATTLGPKHVYFDVVGLSGAGADVTVNAPGPAALMTANVGNGIAQILTQLPTSFVKITDADGNAILGVAVTFAVTGGGGSITNTTQTTDFKGIAATGWSLGGTEGTNTLSATASGVSFSPATITLTATAVRLRNLAAGPYYTCGVTTANQLYCWGRVLPIATFTLGLPIRVDTPVPFEKVTAGDRHLCGITASGAAYCAGENTYGQIGDGTTTLRSTPVAVAGGHSFKQIEAGGYYTCAVTTAGAAYCWGRNRWPEDTPFAGAFREGFLGDGTNVNRSAPVAVMGGLSFRSVSAGLHHTCGVTTTNQAYCWGNNRYGQLGTTAVPHFNLSGDQNARTPVAVEGGLAFDSVSAIAPYAFEFASTTSHTCGITASGAAYCWGSGDHGQLGNGEKANKASPVAVTGGRIFSTVNSGWAHACSVASGSAYCWGYLLSSTGGRVDTPSPSAVGGGLTFTLVTAGEGFACGLASDGRAYCWGDNGFGQLGDLTETDRLTPVLMRWP